MWIFVSLGISLWIWDFSKREVSKKLYNKSEAIKELREAYENWTATRDEFMEWAEFLIKSPDNSLYSIKR